MKHNLDWDWAVSCKKVENPVIPVINYFIELFNYKKYLELGLQHGLTYNYIDCESKESVDKESKFKPTYVTTTDEFFKSLEKNKKWDAIFIDAYHEKEYVKRDIVNSLKHLNKNGIIFTHDVNPNHEELFKKNFCYNAWEAFVFFRQRQPNLFMFTFPFGHLGAIRRGKQKLWTGGIEPTWDFFNDNRKEMMNQLTKEEFFNMFKETK